jgi:hypothetical protein
MMQDKYQTYASQSQSRPASEIAAERREQIAADLAAMQERKDRDLVQQTAMESSPETRISLWERRHGLALPRSPQHPLLQFVANSTGLQMAQVIEEQTRRERRRATAVVS